LAPSARHKPRARFVVTDQDGTIPWPSSKDLYFFDTRMISSWQIFANGERWELLNAGKISHYAAGIVLTNQNKPTSASVPNMRRYRSYR
jgi:glycogen debranching enzyme-like protein